MKRLPFKSPKIRLPRNLSSTQFKQFGSAQTQTPRVSQETQQDQADQSLPQLDLREI